MRQRKKLTLFLTILFAVNIVIIAFAQAFIAAEREVPAGIAILKAVGARQDGVNIVSCPTCGRCNIDLIPIADEVGKRLAGCKKNITVAVMGCAVNGPGEASAADFGIAAGEV